MAMNVMSYSRRSWSSWTKVWKSQTTQNTHVSITVRRKLLIMRF